MRRRALGRIKSGLLFTTSGGGFEANKGGVSDFGLVSRFGADLFARMEEEEESMYCLFASRFLSEGDGGVSMMLCPRPFNRFQHCFDATYSHRTVYILTDISGTSLTF